MLNLLIVSCKMAFRSLKRNKIRSLLTMLGIIIGVGSVITMVSIGKGAEKEVQERIRQLGRNILYVWTESKKEKGLKKPSILKRLKPDDAEAIKRDCPAVGCVSPIVGIITQVVSGSQNWEVETVGASEDYLEIREWPLAKGEFFTPSQIRSSAKVCVLGQTVSRELFGESNPIGRIVRIKKVPFRVIGVLSVKGQTSRGGDQDDIIIVPYTTAMKKLLGARKTVYYIIVSAITPEHSKTAQYEMTEILRRRHRLQEGIRNDFVIRDMVELISIEQKNKRTFTFLLGGTAAISLLVGGIGIMNIMLVSVMERTREIGIRLATGAKERDIMTQFLIESVILSISGGIVGIMLGVGATYIVAMIPDWQKTTLSLTSIFVAFLFSAIVGIFFGFYPAQKAASLDPIEALRYE